MNDIFFTPKQKQFYMMVSLHDDFMICTSFCDYYHNVYSEIGTQKLSRDFVTESIPVLGIDELGNDVKYDGKGWRYMPNITPSEYNAITHLKRLLSEEESYKVLWAKRYEVARGLLSFWNKRKLATLLKEQGLL